MATFNWLITCGCNNPIEYHCNTCGENLCSNCKQTHLQNHDTRHHSVVEYTKRLTPGSLSSLLCHEHNGKECVCWCQTCGKAACIDCVTKSHRGHEFTELETVLHEKRVSLQKELNNLESNVLKEWQCLMIEAEEVTSNFLDRVNEIEEELAERAKEFHKKVDAIMENTKKQLNEFKTSSLVVLHEQEKKVLIGLETVKQEIKECEDRLRSSDLESLLDHEDTKDDMKDILPTVSGVLQPVFISNHIDTKSLTEMFGKLTVPKSKNGAEGHSQPSIDASKETTKSSTIGAAKQQTVLEPIQSMAAGLSSSLQTSTRDYQTSGDTAPNKSSTQLIPKPSLLSKFSTDSMDPSVTCVGLGQAWVETDRKMIQMVDRHGAVKDKIHTDFGFNDMTVTPLGDILLSDARNKCIKSISADKAVMTMFNVTWEPYGLCCLQNGNIAVTFEREGRVVLYSTSGNVIKEPNKELFTQPHSVAQSKVNSDLYISDLGARKVVALNKDYRVRYEYTGQDDRTYYDRKPFSPHGLCTDNAGRVLVTDFQNNRVHILDRDGQFLQYLLTKEQGLIMPWSINVDSEGYAWVGDGSIYGGGCVKVVKYLQ